MTDEPIVTVEDLQARELFKDVPANVLKKLLESAPLRFLKFESRAPLRLTREGIEYIYIIVEGYLEVRFNSQLIKKGPDFLIAFRGPEQVVGEMKAISESPGEATIKARGRCSLIEIPTAAFVQIAERDWRIFRNLARILIKKAFQERKRIEVIQMPMGEAQVAQTLLNFLGERGSEITENRNLLINGVVRHADIAGYIGCDRTTVARRLRNLKQQNVIDYPDTGRNPGQRITIRSRQALQRIARIRS